VPARFMDNGYGEVSAALAKKMNADERRAL